MSRGNRGCPALTRPENAFAIGVRHMGEAQLGGNFSGARVPFRRRTLRNQAGRLLDTKSLATSTLLLRHLRQEFRLALLHIFRRGVGDVLREGPLVPERV